MNIVWALILILIGFVILSMGIDNWSGNIGNYIGVILGTLFLLLGFYMFKSKKSNYVLIKDGFLTIRPATDNSFHIPINSIQYIRFKDDKNRITDLSDIGANSGKSAVNDYKIFIKTDETKEINISFGFSGIKISDLVDFLLKHRLF